MGDIFRHVTAADPDWWRAWIIEPLAPVGLVDKTTGRWRPQPDVIELQTLHDQEAALGRLTAALNRAWARYAATFGDIAATQNRVEELVVGQATRATKTFFADARAAILAQIKSEHRWYTGIHDGTKVMVAGAQSLGKRVGHAINRWVNPSTAAGNTASPAVAANPDAAPENDSAAHVRPAVQLIERVLTEHISPSRIEGALNEALQSSADQVRLLWSETLKLVLPSGMADSAQPLAQGGSSTTPIGPAELDRSFEILVSGTLATVGATLALAAGWHTIGWSLLNLFPPALVAALLLTGAYAWLNKDRARAKLERAVETILTTVEQKVLTDIEIHIRQDARENARRTAENLRAVAYRSYVQCKCDERTYVALIRVLESHLDEITCRSHALTSRAAAPLRRTLDESLAESRTRLAQGDLTAGAFLFGQSVELLLQLLAVRFREPLAPRGKDHIFDLIGRLQHERLITDAQADALHRARIRRNDLFHGFAATAAVHGLHFAEWLREGLTEIEELLPAVSMG